MGDQVSQAEFIFHKSVLTASDHLVVLYVLCNDIQDGLLHGIPWY